MFLRRGAKGGRKKIGVATLKIESGLDGHMWVMLTRFGVENLARLKKHR